MIPLVQIPLESNPAYRQLTVEEFFELEMEGRAELDDGMLYMMAGGSHDHGNVSANILVALRSKLRGSECRAFGPDITVRTGPASLRLPDASVYCGLRDTAEQRRAKTLGDPKVVVEVLSPSTRRLDEKIKLLEYQALAGVDLILLVDHQAERVRLVERSGPEAWSDCWLKQGADVPLSSLKISLTADEIFALD